MHMPTAKKYGLALTGLCLTHPDDKLDRAKRELAEYGFCPRVYEDFREMLLRKCRISRVNSVIAENSEIALCAGAWHKRFL